MKIGYVTLNQGSYRGGSEKLWRESACQAIENGHEAVVSVYANSVIPTQEIFKDRNVSIEARLNFNGFTLWRRLSLYTKRFFRNDDIDAIVVSCGGLAEIELKINQTRIKQMSVPYVVLIHSNTDNWTFSNKNQRTISNILKNAEKVFFVSKKLIKQSESQLSIKLTNASIIKNPIKRVDSSPLPKTKGIAFIGSVDIAVKGIGLLIETFANNIWGDRGVILNIYGEGRDELEIANIIKKYRMQDRVKMHGWVENIDDVWEENLTLISTSFNEGMPMVIQEAMMRGRVVVATDVGGATEIIEDGVSGFIANHPTVEDINYALERWWDERDNWVQVAKKGVESVNVYLDSTPGSESIIKSFTHD